VGAPLPVEARSQIPSWGHDEDFVWDVIADVTGLTYDGDVRYEVRTVASHP
jgi:hypothetical protein